jgi:hypothetical protein
LGQAGVTAEELCSTRWRAAITWFDVAVITLLVGLKNPVATGAKRGFDHGF